MVEPEKAEQVVGVFRKFNDLLRKITWSSILKLTILVLVFMIAISWYKFINDRDTATMISNIIHTEREKAEIADSLSYSITDEVEKRVNEEAEELRLALDADRVIISIFHDNLKTTTNLHFRFFSECYEKVCYDRGIPEIAESYQNIRTSLFPIMSYLSQNRELYTTPKEVGNIDRRYANRLEEENVGWVGLRFLRNKHGIEIGIISVAWSNNNLNNMPKKEKIQESLTKGSIRLESLLDLESYVKLHNKR